MNTSDLSSHPILVMGARTGIGRLVVDALHASGMPVRATSRRASDVPTRPGVEAVTADLTDPVGLERAFAGVSRAFVLAVAGSAPGLLAAARRAEVQRLVLLSSGSVLVPSCATNPITVQHREVEEALTSADGPRVVPVRPLVLASNALAWAFQLRDTGAVRLYQPDARNAPVHEADVAAVVVRALLAGDDPRAAVDPALSGLLTGPVQLSVRDQVATIGRTLGRELPVVEESRAEAVARLARFVGVVEADAVCAFYDDCAAGNSPATGTARTVLGRDPRDFETWARDHVEDFR